MLSFILPILLGCSTVQTWAQSLSAPPIILGVGEQRRIHIPGLKRYSMGGSEAHIHPLGAHSNDLLIKGVRAGSNDLWVWKTDGSTEVRQIQIENWNTESKPKPLLRELGRLQEVEVYFTGTHAILRGQILSLGEAARIEVLLRSFSQDIQNEAIPSPELRARIAQELSTWIERNHLQEQLSPEWLDASVTIQGALPDPQKRKSAEMQLRRIWPLLSWDVQSLPDRNPTVHFRVFLLELKKTSYTSLGLEWPVDHAFQIAPWKIQTSSTVDLALHALETQGKLKILSSPELVVRAPGEAELFSGGELPIHTFSKFQSQVQWKNFGLTLHLKVQQSAGTQVRLEISTEVSHLDHEIAMNQIPGLQANRMKTEVDATYGAPLLLSGLLQEGMRESARGIPGLRSIPILGKLFGSEDYQNERSELVAILYPSKKVPQAQARRFAGERPRGSTPPPRNFISPEQEIQLKQSPDYPWNVFDDSRS